MENVTIRNIKRDDDSYPGRMKMLPQMPDELFVIGELPAEHVPTIGMVGARACDGYGQKIAREFGTAFARCGIQVISGMAVGIDGYSQEGALAGGGKTFAVLGSGVDVCYPEGHRTLYEKIQKKGGVISELPPGTAPLRRNFPLRNRIISALSDLVLVIEARSKSGSLITADFALEQGKTVFAVPGRVGDQLSDGCNYLIAQGAGIAWSADAVIEELLSRGQVPSLKTLDQKKEGAKRALSEKIAQDPLLSDEARALFYRVPETDFFTADDLLARCSCPIAVVASCITELLCAGYLEEIGFGTYRRKEQP
ncbi:MAG: DNA-processing protein DprA [Lachnospiraceae bacterium]|nr:DNA-processing protein DprA [Lachnospiraceae bacterium]